jgi:hypothetical protein
MVGLLGQSSLLPGTLSPSGRAVRNVTLPSRLVGFVQTKVNESSTKRLVLRQNQPEISSAVACQILSQQDLACSSCGRLVQ